MSNTSDPVALAKLSNELRIWIIDMLTEAKSGHPGGSLSAIDLLTALCARGGAATKEQLLEDAWGVREYHPLQHDNRLKVAVRKLRRLLEEVLGDDPIEAADDGYRLRGKVRFLE